jgi:hypothetical protein
MHHVIFLLMDDSEELRNPFPSPPSHYATYTSHNLTLLSVLQQRTAEQPAELNQHLILDDCTDVPEWPLTQLQKPRVDWILEDGEFYVFGERWDVRRFPLCNIAFRLEVFRSRKQSRLSQTRAATSSIPQIQTLVCIHQTIHTHSNPIYFQTVVQLFSQFSALF